MEEYKKFWACWKAGSGAPSCQHETKEAALKEAARLASKNASAVFVLEVVGVAEPQTFPTKYIDL